MNEDDLAKILAWFFEEKNDRILFCIFTTAWISNLRSSRKKNPIYFLSEFYSTVIVASIKTKSCPFDL